MSSCVSWEPFCYWGNTLNVACHLFVKELKYSIRFFLPAKNGHVGNYRTCSGNSFIKYKNVPFLITAELILFPQMPAWGNVGKIYAFFFFLEPSVWKFHIRDLNMKYWHHLKQMEIYKSVVTFFMNIIKNNAFFPHSKSHHILKFQ